LTNKKTAIYCRYAIAAWIFLAAFFAQMNAVFASLKQMMPIVRMARELLLSNVNWLKNGV